MRGASITADTIGDPKVSVREVSTWRGWGLVREHILFDTPPAQSEARHCSAPSPIGGKPEFQHFADADAEVDDGPGAAWRDGTAGTPHAKAR